MTPQMPEKKTKPIRNPLVGKKVTSSIASSGGGTLFQARVQALYLANMLTGLETAHSVSGGRVRSIRFEARYTGAHTDDILCEVESPNGQLWRCFVQCKRTIDVQKGDPQFVEALEGAWRDWRDQTPFNRSHDFLVIASAAPAPTSVTSARKVCAMARSSSDFGDLVTKLETAGLVSKKVGGAWNALCAVSQDTLGEEYSDDKLFQFLRRLRFDVPDLGSADTQEMSLFSGLMGAWCSHPELGPLFVSGLVDYCLEMGQTTGTATTESWRSSASKALLAAFNRGQTGASGMAATWIKLKERAALQLAQISTGLPNGVHIDRLDLESEVLHKIEEHQIVLVSGGPGVGKSGVVAGLAPVLAELGPVFLFRADELDAPTLDAALAASGILDGTQTLIAAANAYPRVTIVVDSLEKCLEFSKRGAVSDLFGLAHGRSSIRFVATARSYAVTPLHTNFLHDLSVSLVEIPPFSDAELTCALQASGFPDSDVADEGLRRVIRVPFYLRLAVSHRMRGQTLYGFKEDDLRMHLWCEGIAPSNGEGSGLSARRRRAFDEVCFNRTERLAQFVVPPRDDEAVEALRRDGILVSDPTGRVAPAHDVFEDWSLFFRVEQEVVTAEQDWDVLFGVLGAHPGLRRAFRAWMAERVASSDQNATSLLDFCITTDRAPQLWREEAMVGLLRSPANELFLRKYGSALANNKFALLQRIVHVLRISCKGPAVSQGAPVDDSEAAKEFRIRQAMTTPVGDAWDNVLRLVDMNKETLPDDAWPWVAAFLEDFLAIANTWQQPSVRTTAIFNLAEHYLTCFDTRWDREEPLPKRFFGFLLQTIGGARLRAKAYFEGLIERVSTAVSTSSRDFQAEERLEFALKFGNSTQFAAFLPSVVLAALSVMYVGEDEMETRQHTPGRRKTIGFRTFSISPFFPASCLQGPFRQLLTYHPKKTIEFIVTLANNTAAAYWNFDSNSSLVLVAPESSPNLVEHLHAEEFWSCYRGATVINDLLASALMALEERLLFDATSDSLGCSATLENILDAGTSTFTTSVICSVLAAHPELLTDNLMKVFRCSAFFAADKARLGYEISPFAIHGGNDGFDEYRQKERAASNNLPHRSLDLEALALKVQFEQQALRPELHRILDRHIEALQAVPLCEQDDYWRLALKRMDIRGLRLGAPVGDGAYRALEIVNLEPDLAGRAENAQQRSVQANRLAHLQLWTASSTGRRVKDSKFQFESPTDVLATVRLVHDSESEEEKEFSKGLDLEVAAALVLEMRGMDAACDQWARDRLLDNSEVSSSSWFGGHQTMISIARALAALAAEDPVDLRLPMALVVTATHEEAEVRFALADALCTRSSELQPALVMAIAQGMARYAELTDLAQNRPWQRRERALLAATRLARRELIRRVHGEVLRVPVMGTSPGNPGDWLNAVRCADGLADWKWRHTALYALVEAAAVSEKSRSRDFPYATRRQLIEAFALELLRQGKSGEYAVVKFAEKLPLAPEFCADVLGRVLSVLDQRQFHDSAQLWRLWDAAGRIVFSEPSLRVQYPSRSKFDGPLQQLLFVGTEWRDGIHHIGLFDDRPSYVEDCLPYIGDSARGLAFSLKLMATIARQSAVPKAMSALRDAIAQHSADPFANSNNRWYAETICRVAVHGHREELLKSINLRTATLEILNRLIDSGSSIAFQLRDYLVTAATKGGAI